MEYQHIIPNLGSNKEKIMRIKKLITVIPFLFLVACGGSNTGNNPELSGIPQTEKEMRSFLKSAVEISQREIPKQRQELQGQNHDKNYAIYPIEVSLSNDGKGLIWNREVIGTNEAMIEVLGFFGGVSPENYCMPESISIMQKFNYHVIENLYNGNQLIHTQIFDLARCQEYLETGQ